MTNRIRDAASVLGIFLATEPGHRLRVGTLVRDGSGVIVFHVDPGYVALGERRPIVSSSWRGETEAQSLDRLRSTADKVMQGALLPPFFQNLLPEGALRELVDREFGEGPFDSFDVLAKLGADLPGALVATVESGTAPIPLGAGNPPAAQDAPRITFSLAGVQLKFSMTHKSGRLTSPASDTSGEIILKTPSDRHAFLPEAEFAGLSLARAAGVETADAWLVEPGDIEGIPARYLTGPARSLAVRRFDREPGGRRVQIEDFGQIVGVITERDKYTKANDETVLNIVRRFASDRTGQVLEGVRRMVANILTGNGDAHLKNWSLMYRGTETSLTPAYDIVPTFFYSDETMALQLGGTKNPRIMGLQKIRGAAKVIGMDPDLLAREASLTVERALDVWPGLLDALPLPEEMGRALLDRLSTLRIVREARPTYVPGAALGL